MYYLFPPPHPPRAAPKSSPSHWHIGTSADGSRQHPQLQYLTVSRTRRILSPCHSTVFSNPAHLSNILSHKLCFWIIFLLAEQPPLHIFPPSGGFYSIFCSFCDPPSRQLMSQPLGAGPSRQEVTAPDRKPRHKALRGHT